MNDHIGTCGNCGGRVMTHSGPWFGTAPPSPMCESCGAQPRAPRMPIIEMEPEAAVTDRIIRFVLSVGGDAALAEATAKLMRSQEWIDRCNGAGGRR